MILAVFCSTAFPGDSRADAFEDLEAEKAKIGDWIKKERANTNEPSYPNPDVPGGLEGLRARALSADCSAGVRGFLADSRFEWASSLSNIIAKYKEGAILINSEVYDKAKAEILTQGAPPPLVASILASQYVPTTVHEAQHAANQKATGCSLACVEDEMFGYIVGVSCYPELERGAPGESAPEALRYQSPLIRAEEKVVKAWRERGTKGVRDLLDGDSLAKKRSIHDPDYLKDQSTSLGMRLTVLEQAWSACQGGSESCAKALGPGPIGLLRLKGREDLDREIRITRSAIQCLTPETVERARKYYSGLEREAEQLRCRQFPGACAN